MVSFRTTRRTRAISIVLMLVFSFVALGGCTGCLAQVPKQQESACCKHNKNCDQKPAQPSGERCLTQVVDLGSAEGVKSTSTVHMVYTPIPMSIGAPRADSLPVPVAAPAEPSPHVSPPDRLALLSSFLI
jgi:hypothetical protein